MGAIRKAENKDISFIVEAIVAAEKSNSEKLSLSLLFGLAEDNVKELITFMLEEEIDGCEFSLNSFLIYEENDKPVAAVAGWIEGFGDDLKSGLLKSNLISFTFPKESLKVFSENSKVLTDISIEREINSLQIEYVYVKGNYRGNRLAEKLINEHIKQSKIISPSISKVQVQVFKNNLIASKAYQRIGFNIVKEFESTNTKILQFLPFNVKILMEKQL